ncbi:MAG: putative motility protein [Lachnospiraceae bacterium]|nr:putative motility protein [Lachnospiraceae bacterium]
MMDIAALSADYSLADVSTDIGIAVLSNSLELIDDMGEGMIKIMESSVNPELGQNVDLRI